MAEFDPVSVINNIRSRIEMLKERQAKTFAAIIEDNKASQEEIDNAKAQLVNLQREIKATEQQRDELEERLQNSGEQKESLNAELVKKRAALEELSGQLHNAQRELTTLSSREQKTKSALEHVASETLASTEEDLTRYSAEFERGRKRRSLEFSQAMTALDKDVESYS